MSTDLHAAWLGREAFRPVLERQLRARDELAEGRGPARLYCVEHPPTLTLGRRGSRDDVLWTDAQLEAADVAVEPTPRGGEVTLHAPGQLVCYPVVRVGRYIRAHIVAMADATIEVFRGLGVEGMEFRMEHPGVWRGTEKLASIGIHVSRGITVQGISLNLQVPPALFGALVSCGMPEVSMRSVGDLVDGPLPSMKDLARQWASAFADKTDHCVLWEEPTAAPAILDP